MELEPFIASDILEMPETNLLICRWRHPDLKREALYLVSDSGDIKYVFSLVLSWYATCLDYFGALWLCL